MHVYQPPRWWLCLCVCTHHVTGRDGVRGEYDDWENGSVCVCVCILAEAKKTASSAERNKEVPSTASPSFFPVSFTVFVLQGCAITMDRLLFSTFWFQPVRNLGCWRIEEKTKEKQKELYSHTASSGIWKVVSLSLCISSFIAQWWLLPPLPRSLHLTFFLGSCRTCNSPSRSSVSP